MTLPRHDHVRFGFAAFVIEQLRKLCESLFDLPVLGWSQRFKFASVGDLHCVLQLPDRQARTRL
jgi:hypothetical protein